jgi:hypothetical protein
MRARPVLIGVAAVVIAALAAYLWYLIPALALGGTCADEVRGESASPDGRVLATSYIRNCGATTGYSSHVSLRTAKAPFNPDKDFTALVIDGVCDVEMSWSAVTTLLLQNPATCEVIRRESRWRDIQISFTPQ